VKAAYDDEFAVAAAIIIAGIAAKGKMNKKKRKKTCGRNIG